jgi:hypothetical protein
VKGGGPFGVASTTQEPTTLAGPATAFCVLIAPKTMADTPARRIFAAVLVVLILALLVWR